MSVGSAFNTVVDEFQVSTSVVSGKFEFGAGAHVSAGRQVEHRWHHEFVAYVGHM